MSPRLPDIDFRRIRPYGSPASRDGGFEELACTLIEEAVCEWPEGTEFARFGDPDGGREGRATLPDGTVCAWQAKYLFLFDASATSQIERSVERVLQNEPMLCRYLVVLPIDLPAGDTPGRTSARYRWENKVGEWRESALASGRSVEFALIGKHELVKALTSPGQAGRLRYWFDESFMDGPWFQYRLDEAIEKAGPRYSPDVHIGVEAAQVLEGLGRTDRFTAEWREYLAVLRESRPGHWTAPEGDTGELAEALSACKAAIEEVDSAISSIILALGGYGDLPAPDNEIQVAQEEIWNILGLLRANHLSKTGFYVGDAAFLHRDATRALGALDNLAALAGSMSTGAARVGKALIAGKAGTGKTHLFCDIAKVRVETGCPTVLVMGQDFDQRAPHLQIPELTSFDGSAEEEVEALAAAAEASGVVGLLMIDALNESERPEGWNDNLRVLQRIVARHKQVALAVSCRSEFVSEAVGDTTMPNIEHEGFGEATEAAVVRYAQHYDIGSVSFPVLNSEFSNPLFLRLACEALATLGRDSFHLDSAGLTTVCDAFLEAVNDRLSHRERCDYDPARRLVQQAVRVLAEATESPPIEWEAAEQLLQDIHPSAGWSKSLLKGLIDEGVLIKTPAGVGFGYQRLGDLARAALHSEKTDAEIRQWATSLGRRRWSHRGVLGALAVMLPETRGVELIQTLADDEGKVSRDQLDLFVDSLVLRSAGAVSTITVGIVRQLLGNDDLRELLFDQLVRLSCVPGHALNADLFHAWLMEQDLAERDAQWSLFLVDQTEYQTPVRRLINWARDNSGGAKPEVRRLAGVMLGWMLTTSDNRVRDQATKALVALFEPAPDTAAEVLRSFRGVDDPYVLERLAAAACGAALRSSDSTAHHKLANGTTDMFADGWPAHLLTRDYGHRIFRLAVSTGWNPPGGGSPDGHPYGGPPYGAELPVPTRTTSQIETMAGPPNYRYGSIWRSIDDGDFGRYILAPALGHFDLDRQGDLIDLAERTVFDRVVELGWTPEVFQKVDRSLSSTSGRDHAVERVGKKYQRIAFYELLGRLADNYAIREWGDSPAMPYSHAKQLVYRDIDPTVLTRKPETDPPTPWFSPAQAAFDPKEAGKEPTEIEGTPDPLDLIAATDQNSESWLVLETYADWKEPLAPEQKALRPPEVWVRLQICGYLIPEDKLTEIREWAEGKDWSEFEILKSPDVYNALLASHPDDPAWAQASTEPDRWLRQSEQLPCDLFPAAAQYAGTGTDRDYSAAQETIGYVPSGRLHNLLRLTRCGDFEWKNQQGVTIARDPSVTVGGPAALLAHRDETVERLSEAGLTIFWTALAAKDLIQQDFGQPANPRWVTASAAYALDNSDVVLLYATARSYVGPTETDKQSWSDILRDRG
ncbi:MAG: hypothetical protein KTV68_08615 [Acidimicrobiia bacterium]|nr:hypothetical protein [Acidimicrobiia bacterium]MCY4434429.1 hypothetical protein [bacterium]